MSGRNQPLHGKRRAHTKAPGKKPNAARQRVLAKRRRTTQQRLVRQELRAAKTAGTAE
jgi:hypothetical protein